MSLKAATIELGRWGGHAAAGLAFLALAACQAEPASSQAGGTGTAGGPGVMTLAPVYSGYFVWDSEREHGDAALQCMQLVLNSEETLADGRVRLTGVTRYITGPNDEVTFAEAEVIFDPDTRAFEMRERNPTSDNFVSDGRFLGKAKPGRLLLEGLWQSDGGGESGRLTLRIGADAPCTMARDA